METDLGNLGSNPVFKTQTITIGSLSVKGGVSGLAFSDYKITPSIPTGYTLIGCVGIMPDTAIFCGLIYKSNSYYINFANQYHSDITITNVKIRLIYQKN